MNLRARYVPLILVTVQMNSSACTARMQVLPGDVAQYESVYVTLKDGASWKLFGAVVESDTLRGTPEIDTVRVSFPLSDVSEVEVDQPDVDKTTALVLVGSLLLLTGVLLAAWLASGEVS